MHAATVFLAPLVGSVVQGDFILRGPFCPHCTAGSTLGVSMMHWDRPLGSRLFLLQASDTQDPPQQEFSDIVPARTHTEEHKDRGTWWKKGRHGSAPEQMLAVGLHLSETRKHIRRGPHKWQPSPKEPGTCVLSTWCWGKKSRSLGKSQVCFYVQEKCVLDYLCHFFPQAERRTGMPRDFENSRSASYQVASVIYSHCSFSEMVDQSPRVCVAWPHSPEAEDCITDSERLLLLD